MQIANFIKKFTYFIDFLLCTYMFAETSEHQVITTMHEQ